jgi:Protein of unknown function (DUF3455)
MRSVIPTILLLTTFSAFSLVAQAQDHTQPPPDQHPILTVTGKGVQIYTCQKGPTNAQWIFQAPEAILTDPSGAPVGTHGAGPIWKSKDGSTVSGDVLQKSASPDPGAIPWLLLKAITPTSSGVMSHVEYIRRSDTHGGIPPTTPCDAGHLNASARIPYTATYTFYSAKP